MGPINYLANIPDLTAQFNGLRNAIQQRQINEKQAAAVKASEDLKQQYSKDLRETFASGTPEAFSRLIAKYPKQHDAFKGSWDILSEGDRDAEFKEAAELYSAVEFNPDIAKQMLDEKIESAKNSNIDPSVLKTIRDTLDEDPGRVKSQLAFTLSSVDPDKWGKMTTEMRKRAEHPTNLEKKQADADKAKTDAQYREREKIAGLDKTKAETAQMLDDMGFKKEANRISAMGVAAEREHNALKRQDLQLKIKNAQRKMDYEVRQRKSQLHSNDQKIELAISSINRLMENPELNNILGSVEGSKFYPGLAVGLLAPGADADVRADALADLENIKSQAFLNNLIDIKGNGATFGNLTEKEGFRIMGYITNLDRQQSEKHFRENLGRALSELRISQTKLRDKYSDVLAVPIDHLAPLEREVLSPPADSDDDIDALLLKYGQ